MHASASVQSTMQVVIGGGAIAGDDTAVTTPGEGQESWWPLWIRPAYDMDDSFYHDLDDFSSYRSGPLRADLLARGCL